MRHALYARKSDDDRSVTEKSIGEQVSECRRLAEAAAVSLEYEFEESRSARRPGRRAKWTELVRLIERGKVDGIVCWHVNRLVRNMEEGGHLAQLLIDGRLKEIRTPSAVYRTGDNIMPLVIEAASATQFSLDHARTVSRGMEGKFRAGGCNNLAPQGYRNARDPLNLKKGRVERDPERWETVRRAWDLMLKGTYTVRQVVDTMNGPWGYRTRPTRKRQPKRLSQSGGYLVFTNPFYAGFVRRKGELVRGVHEPMVTPEEFERVQEILGRRSFAAPRVREYAFTGLMRCARCGQRITAEVKRLRDGRLWENYRCSDASLTCTKKGLSREKVEAFVAEAIDSLRVDPELLAIAEANVRRYLERDGESVESLVRSQEEALRQVENRLSRLSDMWLDGILTDEVRFREIERREKARQADIARGLEHARLTAARAKANLERGCRFLATAAEEIRVVPDARKREICASLAVGFLFDGVAKTLEIRIHPLLECLVSYSRKLAPFEPSKSVSRKRNEPALVGPVHSGGRDSRLVEPPENLISAIRGGLYADLWPNDRRSFSDRDEGLAGP